MLAENSPSNLWPAVSAISQFGLVVAAGFGFWQLNLAKRGLHQSAKLARIRATRESYKLAAEQCVCYSRDLIPLINRCDEALDSIGAGHILPSFSVEIRGEMLSVAAPRPLPPNFAKTFFSLEFLRSILEAQNALETFAIVFTSGVAAEDVAFRSVGRSFCATVKRYAPSMVQVAGQSNIPGTGHYHNALQLFMMWQKRIDQHELLEKQMSISKQLAETNTVKISPIGT